MPLVVWWNILLNSNAIVLSEVVAVVTLLVMVSVVRGGPRTPLHYHPQGAYFVPC